MNVLYDRSKVQIRRGKIRKHREGYSINIFLGDDTLLATVYGGSENETFERVHIVVSGFETTYRGY